MLRLTRIGMLLLLLIITACGTSPATPATATPSSAAAPATVAPATGAAVAHAIVYKSPTCGCCGKWIEHMEAHGFSVEVKNLADVTSVKDEHGVPPATRSCHTALIDGYVVEGHVPATEIRRLLAERPDVVGIAVPGMPAGSPGMEGGTVQPYDVLSFDEAGATSVFAQYGR